MLGRDHASAHVAILAYLELGRSAWLFVAQSGQTLGTDDLPELRGTRARAADLSS